MAQMSVHTWDPKLMFPVVPFPCIGRQGLASPKPTVENGEGYLLIWLAWDALNCVYMAGQNAYPKWNFGKWNRPKPSGDILTSHMTQEYLTNLFG